LPPARSASIGRRVDPVQGEEMVPGWEAGRRRVRVRPIEGVAEIATLVACDRFSWGIGLVVLADEEFRAPIGDDGLRECCPEDVEEFVCPKFDSERSPVLDTIRRLCPSGSAAGILRIA
jgi:hypothetical protein